MKLRRKVILRLLYSVLLLLLLGGTISICLQLRQASLDSALISAIKKREDSKAIALLDEGANANAVDSSDNPTTIKTLLAELRARIWGRRGVGSTRSGIPAIMLACEEPERSIWPPGSKFPIKRKVPRSVDQKLLSALLKHGGDPNSWDRGTGLTALYSQVISGDPVTVKILLEAGSNPNEVTIPPSPIPPLVNAVACNEYEIARLLLQHGVAVDTVGPNGMSALHYAMSVGDDKMLNLVLSYHANANAQDDDGWTPLMYDDRWRIERVRLLVQHGARALIQNKNGDTAIDRARAVLPESPKKTEILRILTDAARREAAGK